MSASRPHVVRAVPANQVYGSIALTAWILIFLTCGIALVPFLGFAAYIIGIPLLVTAFVLSIIVMTRGGYMHGFILLLMSLAAPIFVIITPWLTTATTVSTLAKQSNEPVQSGATQEEYVGPAPAAIAAPSAPTPRPLPSEVSIKEPVKIALELDGKGSGFVTLQPGTKVSLAARDGENLEIIYSHTTATIPASATDFAERW